MNDADYVLYALKQLQISIEKWDDAPVSAAQHERNALFALAKGRIPTAVEELTSWDSPICEEDASGRKNA